MVASAPNTPIFASIIAFLVFQLKNMKFAEHDELKIISCISCKVDVKICYISGDRLIEFFLGHCFMGASSRP